MCFVLEGKTSEKTLQCKLTDLMREDITLKMSHLICWLIMITLLHLINAASN